LSWAAAAGSPGGSNTQLQYNNSGSFGGASGLVTDGSNLTINGQGDLRFADSDSSNWVAFQAPATVASNITWTLPNADGTSGQFLSTDGSGALSWATASGGGGGGGTSTTTTQFTATGGQTSFTVSYTVGQISVYLNGALLAAADYTATNGTSVVLAAGAAAGDILTVVAYSSVTAISQGDSNVTVSDSGSNGTITFTTDNSERMRVTSNGTLLIGRNAAATGTNTQYAFVQIIGNNAGGANYGAIDLLRNEDSANITLDENIGMIHFGDRQAGEYAQIRVAAAGTAAVGDNPGRMSFFTTSAGAATPTERMRIPATGGVQCVTTLSVGNATPATSGAGITFPATQSACSDANTLDDYEEGTWTPSLGGTATYNSNTGTYTKIGRQVTVRGIVNVNTIGTGSASQISGLPFSAATNFHGTCYWGAAASSLDFIVLQTDAGTTIQAYSSTAATATLGVNAVWTSGSNVVFTITYFI
jgi:hypothetical protein